MSTPIHLRNVPAQYNGSLEIIDHPFIISYFAKWYKPNLYLEYGIRDGRCVKQIIPFCKQVWGVDIEDCSSGEIVDSRFTFFKMTTREFGNILRARRPIIDIVFIDACHESNTVVEDFEDIFPFVIENGLIFLHDTYPIDASFTAPIYCNDCWKVPGLLKEKYKDHIELITLPIMPGLTIIKKSTISLPNMVPGLT